MLELKNITKNYGSKQALDHVSLTLENGIYRALDTVICILVVGVDKKPAMLPLSTSI